METQNQVTPQAALKGPVQLIKEAWAMYKQNWSKLISLSVIPYAILVIAVGLLYAQNPLLSVVGVILGIVSALLFVAMQPALLDSIQKIDVGQGSSIAVRSEYKFGFSLFWPMLLVVFIGGLVSTGSFILFVIPAFVVGVYVIFNSLSLVLDGKRGVAAFLESYTLVWGRFWPVVGRMLFLALSYLVVALIFLGIQSIIGSVLNYHPSKEDFNILEFVMNQIIGIIMTPFMLVYFYKLYNSLKTTRMTGASTETFKKWLVAFMIIGALAIVVLLPLLMAGTPQ